MREFENDENILINLYHVSHSITRVVCLMVHFLKHFDIYIS